jgi:hypothetical protein
MRKRRVLKQNVWYEVHTRVNNNEPLFRRFKALAVFGWVFCKSREKYVFEFRHLRLAGDVLTFYIKPADGLQLPAIMKWMKQVFAVKFNKVDGRTGHIWGDRYWSRILEGEPPEPPEESAEEKAKGRAGARPLRGGRAESPRFPPLTHRAAPPSSG